MDFVDTQRFVYGPADQPVEKSASKYKAPAKLVVSVYESEIEMKVFISWSGEESRQVALVLRDWLPSVLQSIEPYVSSEDIDKGARWSSDIASELEASVYGILCITSENIEAPWINFEAGALSKSIQTSFVTPFLFRTKRSDIKGPLVQFQSALDTQDDVKKLISSLNNAQGTAALDAPRIEKIFDRWWPDLEDSLSKIESPEKSKKSGKRDSEEKSDIMEEVITLLRQHTLILNDPTRILPPGYLEEITLRSKRSSKHDTDSDRALIHVIDIVSNMQDLLEGPNDQLDIPILKAMIRELVNPLRYAMEMRHSPGDELSRNSVRKLSRMLHKTSL